MADDKFYNAYEDGIYNPFRKYNAKGAKMPVCDDCQVSIRCEERTEQVDASIALIWKVLIAVMIPLIFGAYGFCFFANKDLVARADYIEMRAEIKEMKADIKQMAIDHAAERRLNGK